MRPSQIREQSILFIRFISSSEITYLLSKEKAKTPLLLSSNTIFRVTNSTHRLLRIGPTTVALMNSALTQNPLRKRRWHKDIEWNNTRLLHIFRMILWLGNESHSIDVILHWVLRKEESLNGVDMWSDFGSRFTLTERFHILKKTVQHLENSHSSSLTWSEFLFAVLTVSGNEDITSGWTSR